MPLPQLEGHTEGSNFLHDPAHVHLALLRELQEADTDASEGLWEVVSGYIAPLNILCSTVAAWSTQPGPNQDVAEVSTQAGDLQLLLDVDLWCDDFRAPHAPRAPLDCCPPLASVGEGEFCFLLSMLRHRVISVTPSGAASLSPQHGVQLPG